VIVRFVDIGRIVNII